MFHADATQKKREKLKKVRKNQINERKNKKKMSSVKQENLKWPIVTHKYRHMRINHHTRVIDHFIYLIAHNNILLAILSNAPHGIALSVLFRSHYSHIFQRNIVVGRRFLPVLNGNLKILYIFRITQFERESLDRYK